MGQKKDTGSYIVNKINIVLATLVVSAISSNASADPEGIYCPLRGGAQEIRSVATSAIGQVTYRFGGTGKTYPENGETKACPEGSSCLDTGSFVKTVFKCAGLEIPLGTTNIFTYL